MSTAKSLLGKRAEELTAAELIRRGCQILETNYRCRYGEIDIIARDDDTIIFIEVRSRRSDETTCPAESVNHKKQAKIVHTARYYLSSHNEFIDFDCRFDVSSVRFERGKPVIVEIIQGAFEEV